jgi:autotransporter translocation and assembly factor TamB
LSGARPENSVYQNILGLDSLYGIFEYNCDIRGSSDYIDGDIFAKAVALEYSGYKVDSLCAAANIRGSKINLDTLNVFFNDLIIKTSGSYDTITAVGDLHTDVFSIVANENLEDNIKLNRGIITTEFGLLSNNDFNFDIECESIWLGILKSFAKIDAPENGFLKLNMSFKGNPAEPHGSLSASAYSISHPSYEIDSVIVAADIADEYLDLNKFQLFAYGNTLTASTDIYLDRDSDNNLVFNDKSAISGEMTVDALDLSILQPYVAPTGRLTGKASVKMAWDGTMKNPGLDGGVEVDNGFLKYQDFSNALERLHLQLNLNDSLFAIDSAF